jgi:hypothetical protein
MFHRFYKPLARHKTKSSTTSIVMHVHQVQASFEAASAANDVGVHSLIQHTDMRTFWRKYFAGLPKVCCASVKIGAAQAADL